MTYNVPLMVVTFGIGISGGSLMVYGLPIAGAGLIIAAVALPWAFAQAESQQADLADETSSVSKSS